MILFWVYYQKHVDFPSLFPAVLCCSLRFKKKSDRCVEREIFAPKSCFSCQNVSFYIGTLSNFRYHSLYTDAFETLTNLFFRSNKNILKKNAQTFQVLLTKSKQRYYESSALLPVPSEKSPKIAGREVQKHIGESSKIDFRII